MWQAVCVVGRRVAGIGSGSSSSSSNGNNNKTFCVPVIKLNFAKNRFKFSLKKMKI
jgi:hypothetical protein